MTRGIYSTDLAERPKGIGCACSDGWELGVISCKFPKKDECFRCMHELSDTVRFRKCCVSR